MVYLFHGNFQADIVEDEWMGRRKAKAKKGKNLRLLWLVTVCLLALAVIGGISDTHAETGDTPATFNMADIPAYSGMPYAVVNDNIPYFEKGEFATASFESYSELDALGRCGTACACIGVDLMPTEERGEIGHIRPSGWHTVNYNGIVDGNYLYNRCHLIGYQLAGENANEKNLITGTRYMNEEGMLPFENMVADYVEGTGNHVLYRVTPVFEGDNLVADGVLMEAESVEDNGAGILFNVFCYNVQPGIVIEYADGSSKVSEASAVEATDKEGASTPSTIPDKEDEPDVYVAAEPAQTDGNYVVNGKNGKIHINGQCPATGSDENAMKEPVYFGTYEEAEAYSVEIKPGLEKRKCGNCW